MKRFIASIFVISLILAVHPMAASSKMLDGFALESPSTLNRGAWNLKTYLEFGSGAEPVTLGPTVSPTGASVGIKVDSIRLPIEVRYGIADNWEIGGDLGFESNDGTAVGTGKYIDGSGLQRLRFLGKWNFFRDMSGLVDLAMLGNNKLYYSLDSFDFGLKFIYGPQVGAGNLNLNLGFLFKGGKANIDGGSNALITNEDYGTVFSYGIGYVYPYSDRFTGIFELAGSSSPYNGSYGSDPLMGFFMGARYGFTEQVLLDGGFQLGFADGSPGFMLKVGLDWAWGVTEEYSSAAPASSSSGKWSESEKPATAKTEKPMADKAATTPKSNEPYYEPPTKYETPKPAAPTPTGPSVEEQLQTRIADASSAFNRGDLVSAAANYEAAIKLKDNDPVIHYNLATTYFQMKKYSDAKTYYKNAVTLNPADVDSRLYLGYTYYYLQDTQSATREWQKVLEIDPSNTLARENLKSLGAE